jgi:hypothetical protein
MNASLLWFIDLASTEPDDDYEDEDDSNGAAACILPLNPIQSFTEFFIGHLFSFGCVLETYVRQLPTPDAEPDFGQGCATRTVGAGMNSAASILIGIGLSVEAASCISLIDSEKLACATPAGPVNSNMQSMIAFPSKTRTIGCTEIVPSFLVVLLIMRCRYLLCVVSVC